MEANTTMMSKENRLCSLYELAQYMSSNEEVDIIVKEYNPVAINESGSNIPAEESLNGFAVQVKGNTKYTFLIGKTCSIESVSIDNGSTFTKIEDFSEAQVGKNEPEKESVQYSYTVISEEAGNLTLSIKVQDAENGLIKAELPNGDVIQYNGSKEEQTITCTVVENTENTIKITNTKGKVTEKVINLKTLEVPTAEYDTTEDVNVVELNLNYPQNVAKKEYKINNGRNIQEK